MSADDLYADLDGPPRLPSTTGLANELSSARADREALEARLESLRAENLTTRGRLEDLTKRACVILATARQELKRKDEQLAQCQREISRAKEGASRRAGASSGGQCMPDGQRPAKVAHEREPARTIVPGAKFVSLSSSDDDQEDSSSKRTRFVSERLSR